MKNIRVSLYWHFLLLCALFLITSAWEEKRCFSIDLRNSPSQGYRPSSATDSWDNFFQCTILDGDVTISMITGENHTDEQFPVFKYLKEITGSMLVYNVKGLTNLGRMFPNLRIIGGQSLIMNYALVIYQNEDLEYIGLNKLTVIRNGGVRIMDNKNLCYTRFINWDNILIGKIKDIMIDQGGSIATGENNKKIQSCKDKYGCEVSNPKQCQSFDGVMSCWNATTCQIYCKYHKINNSTIGPGCTATGERCHDNCLGGCEVVNDPASCYACRDYEFDGTCVKKCPPNTYEYMDNRCVTEQECHRKLPVKSAYGSNKLLWKVFDGKCHYDCPEGYKEDPYNNRSCIKCEDFCPRRCQGTTIDSIGEALKFSKCNIIEGNLDISVQIGGNVARAEKFTEAFGNIREITGYLTIRFCPTFTSLHMFKSLKIIHGENLTNDRYALSVFEMESLKQLFSSEVEQNIEIKRGLVSFQNNPQLCYNKIMRFLSQVGLDKDVSDSDVSKYSNGEKAVCEEVPLNVKVSATFFWGFSLEWTKFNTTDMDQRKFFGYLIYYKKVDKEDPNMDIDDDRSACADSWRMKFVSEDQSEKENQTEMMDELESNTVYAFYVQTKTVHHPGARNAISKIGFAKTKFFVPDPPRLKRYEAKGPNMIILEWDPPVKTNGIITHYTVEWYAKSDGDWNQDPCNSAVRPATSVLISQSNHVENTCPADKGCCKCSDVKAAIKNENSEVQPALELSIDDEEEKAKFENAVQNLVFVQHCAIAYDPRHCGGYEPEYIGTDQPRRLRRRIKQRHHHSRRAVLHTPTPAHRIPKISIKKNYPVDFRPNASTDNANVTSDFANFSKARNARSILSGKEPLKDNEREEDFGHFAFIDASTIVMENITGGKINISSTRVVITGLLHFTEYHIQITACQDVTAPDNYCSKHASSRFVRTEAIPDKDLVDADTVVVEDYIVNGTVRPEGRFITWKVPEEPNSRVTGFNVKISQEGDTFPYEKCVPLAKFEEKNGLEVQLSNGLYSLEIRTLSLAGTSRPIRLVDLFEINIPSWWTWDKILVLLLAILIVIAIIAAFGYRYAQRYLGKKAREYLQQTISANPEYITHLDVYKTDEWELKREDIKLYDEIGRGTFGKVYLGEGNNITSMCGVKFGRCAVKTIPECATNSERLHFLIEASVMKQFNTAYIVKLYGVVSEGQPVLVVMEMMDQGNLRDYLRARRPDAEENTNNAPLPTMINYFKWAAQIADGMAYLESLKFCHRDLAARNCMVANDETVKIGDFGMARDIYYHEYYKPAGKRLMPVRWMAPESLKDGKFTVKSDVWSYGIVMYEMLTLGMQPYAGLGNDQVYNYIGVRRSILNRPAGCPDFWYDLMRICWKYDPRNRPCFYQILLHLRNTIDNSFKDFPSIRNEGMKVFEKSYVMTNYDDIGDEEYDFTYNEEEEENARKHTMLQELERMADGENEYFKSGFGAPNREENQDNENFLGEDEHGEKFKMLALHDLPQVEKPSEPAILTKKQLKERDKKRETINKKQIELEKIRQKKEEETNQYPEAMELVNQKAPLLKTTEEPQPPSPQLSPAAVHIREGDDYKSIGPGINSKGSRHRPPNAATTDVAKQKPEYTEIHPLTKHES